MEGGLTSGSGGLRSQISVQHIIPVQWQASHSNQVFHKSSLNIQFETLDFNLQKNLVLTDRILNALSLWNCIKTFKETVVKKSCPT